jgi:hypothetical protein
MTIHTTILQFGDGRIAISLGECMGKKRLSLAESYEAHQVGSTSRNEFFSKHDVILEFLTLDGACVLHDQLNELISKWRKELSPEANNP